jgi:nitroreductase
MPEFQSFANLWEARYGQRPPTLSPATEAALAPFLTHRSVRNYSQQAISEELTAALVGVANSAATSSNLQLWSLISVQEPERRERIALLAGEQDQVRDAALFFVFVADHDRLGQENARQNLPLDGYELTEAFIVAAVDAALAAERMVCAAEAIGLGTCYIGAMRNKPQEVKEALNLEASTFALFGLCLGYPATDDTSAVKPRLGTTLWHQETYDNARDLSDYNRRMAEFYRSEKMGGDQTWSRRSALRMTPGRMSGRESLGTWLHSQGFLRK